VKAVLEAGGSAVEAVEAVEAAVCCVEADGSELTCVGIGGYPTSEGVMELDAAIMDGSSMRMGAVMAQRDIMHPGE
jgi:isoaspartyl peptidase/L-asparaginase-like protein (Ntn-hydrolase superfamily)